MFFLFVKMYNTYQQRSDTRAKENHDQHEENNDVNVLLLSLLFLLSDVAANPQNDRDVEYCCGAEDQDTCTREQKGKRRVLIMYKIEKTPRTREKT